MSLSKKWCMPKKTHSERVSQSAFSTEHEPLSLRCSFSHHSSPHSGHVGSDSPHQFWYVLVIPGVFPRNKWIDLFPTESRSWRAESQLQTGHLKDVENSASEMEMGQSELLWKRCPSLSGLKKNPMVLPHITHPDVRICVALREFGSTRALAVALHRWLSHVELMNLWICKSPHRNGP